MVVVAAIGGMVTPVAGSLDIFQAVAEDSMHEIKKALRDGANIDQKDPQSGQTPLSKSHFAANSEPPASALVALATPINILEISSH